MDRTSRGKSGFSLTEIMIGVLIMAVAILPAIMVITSESRTVTGTREHSQAAYLGQRIIETARTFHFDKLPEFASEYQAKSFTFHGVRYQVEGLTLTDIRTNDPVDVVAARKLSFSLKFTSRNHDLSLDLIAIITRHE
jgi:prepilin-type N-terminal cleavage/methylation domain-containing protein